MESRTVQFRASDKLREAIATEARRLGVKPSEYMRLRLAEAVGKKSLALTATEASKANGGDHEQ